MWLLAAWFAGCNGPETSVAEQPIAGTGRVPDIKLAWWISSLDLLSCEGELGSDPDLYPSICCTTFGGCQQAAMCGNLIAACGGLSTSANSDPPTSFSDATWASFQQSKEYRGYMHVPSFNVTCNASNQVTSYAPRDPDYVDAQNPTANPDAVPDPGVQDPYGYTKLVAPLKYDPGDVLLDAYNGIHWQVDQRTGTQCVHVTDRRSSRLASNERAIQFVYTQHDAPFIYASLDAVFCCDTGKTTVTVARSTFPHMRLYIDGARVADQDQTGLAQFIKSGGTSFSADGHGVLAPAGAGMSWTGGGWPPPPPPDPCRGTTGTGLWCGRSNQGGFDPMHATASDLYRCTSGATASITDCGALGCFIAPSGVPDSCCPSDPCAHTTGNGLWCGQSTQGGFECGRTGWLYDCESHATHSQTQCPNGCTIAPSGQPDFCTGGCGAGCGPNFHCTGAGCVCNGPVCGAGHCCPAGDFCGSNGQCCDGTCSAGCPC